MKPPSYEEHLKHIEQVAKWKLAVIQFRRMNPHLTCISHIDKTITK